jgi:hypothetical protein
MAKNTFPSFKHGHGDLVLENRWNKTNVYRPPKKYQLFTNDTQKKNFM